MAPVGRRGRSCTRTKHETWQEGTEFDFRKTPEVTPLPEVKLAVRSRRQSLMLKRLDTNLAGVSQSPARNTIRQTRSMTSAKQLTSKAEGLGTSTNASASKIPRALSEKVCNKTSVKAKRLELRPPVAKMVASTSSRANIKPKSTRCSKSTGSLSAASSDSDAPQMRQVERPPSDSSLEVSWIEKISSPQIFYKQTPPSPKIVGAQKRKSYTAATSVPHLEFDSKGQKRSREEVSVENSSDAPDSECPPYKRGRPRSVTSDSATVKKAPTVCRIDNTDHKITGKATKRIAITISKTLRIDKKSMNATREKPTVKHSNGTNRAAKVSPNVKPAQMKRTPSPHLSGKTAHDSHTKSSLNKISRSALPTAVLNMSGSPALRRAGSVTRSVRKRCVARTLTGASPTAANGAKKNSQQFVPIESPAKELTRYLSRSSVLAPSPVKRLVKASRSNPFTPRPEAVPSKLLKQHMKKKLNSEMSTLSTKVGVDALVDPRVALVRTPTEVLLRYCGFVTGDTPVSSPALPPTPTSAKRYVSRSALMVASARRHISVHSDILTRDELHTSQDEHLSKADIPLNSTPRHTSPLYSTYRNGNTRPIPVTPPLYKSSAATGGSDLSLISLTPSLDETVEQVNQSVTRAEVPEVRTEQVSESSPAKKESKKGYCSVM